MYYYNTCTNNKKFHFDLGEQLDQGPYVRSIIMVTFTLIHLKRMCIHTFGQGPRFFSFLFLLLRISISKSTRPVYFDGARNFQSRGTWKRAEPHDGSLKL